MTKRQFSVKSTIYSPVVILSDGYTIILTLGTITSLGILLVDSTISYSMSELCSGFVVAIDNRILKKHVIQIDTLPSSVDSTKQN